MHSFYRNNTRLKSLILRSIIFLAVIQNAAAREDDCTNRIKANRHKTFTYQGSHRVEESYTENDYTVRIRKGEVDSVSVYKNNQLYTTFLAKYRNIISTSIDYTTNGIDYTDSIHKDILRKVVYNYYDYFQSGNVWVTRNHTDGSLMYYDQYGRDSLYFIRYANGQPQKMIWVDGDKAYGRTLWDEDGRLVYEKYRSKEVIYDPPGQLKQLHYDTLMAGRTITCHKTWQANGQLDSITYHYLGRPCHIWTYYAQDGRLLKTVQKTPLGKLPKESPRAKEVYAIEAQQIFRSVSLSEQFPGRLESYLNTAMARILCDSRKPLNGIYSVRAYLSTQGKMTFVSATGENVAAIHTALQQLFDNMPLWQPAKEYPKTVALLLDFHFEIKASNEK